MAGTDSERFDVFFRGECLEGTTETAVRAALGRLFRADGKTLDRLFNGELQRIKRGVDHATAEQYRTAMERAGARPLIRPHGRAPGPAEAATPGGASSAAGVDTSATGTAPAPGAPTGRQEPDLAPVGSDVLRPEERRRDDAPAPVTDHLDLAPAGTDLAENTAPVPARPAPDFDLAEAGTDLQDSRPRGTADAPDVSRITLAAPDHDLSDCAPAAPAAPPPAIDHLALAPPGGDLVDEHERAQPVTAAPGTDHLSLAAAPDDSERDGEAAPNPFDRR